jgi:hypothetical protein
LGLLTITIILFFYIKKISSEGILVVESKINDDSAVSNEIFMTKKTKDKALNFIMSIKDKTEHFHFFDVYLTKKNETLKKLFLTRIQTSKGSLKYFNQFQTDDELLDAIKNGQGKQFYECVKICLSEEKIGKGSCSCGIYFMGY